MTDTNPVVKELFSRLAALTITRVEDAGEVIVLHTTTHGDPAECPAQGTPTATVHAFHERAPADLPVGGRPSIRWVKVCRMRCGIDNCAAKTFWKQVTGLLERYQRHTIRLTAQLLVVIPAVPSSSSFHWSYTVERTDPLLTAAVCERVCEQSSGGRD
ncbi:transposase family protein [Subtercola boreus]|uniref:transposase family protein n=1 Tax=Subtercola boreus TaxID=120213 RepID=UPI0011C04B04|nr:transposase family protein [Subtercola boreus]